MVGWRRGADRAFLQTNSLRTGNLTGNFALLSVQETYRERKTALLQALSCISVRKLTGVNYSKIREFSWRNREFYSPDAMHAPLPTPMSAVRQKRPFQEISF